ncbi:DNA polymerase III, delta prime subunit [Malonomonas rubra DSM 5091]|uniref:DNA polymerase III subunit delta' n=1 Tax=Malonomonas rubra DSM 5091 TaxID=1122189 RepID=A0A1M6DGG1_MALRU|nr:DNA polymerase III subunit delta' [Malonomonas rubra]SHI72356.1 DNA polymerase III, delta prime subunit [Malonomonas rubra DSM 5091]
MTFDSIISHERQKNILRRALQNQRVAHAYLFEGPDGIGKRLMALALARALLCATGKGCGTCAACRKVDHNNHPDVHLLDAEGTTIKIDQIRALQQQLSLKPLEGEYRICLIDGAEHMNPAAANALLKTLEEPQPNTVIVLLSSRPEALLVTIRSRCQRLPFQRLPKQRLTEILADRLDLPETEAAVLAALSDGSFKKALGDNRELYLQQRRELLRSLLALSPGSTVPLFKLAETLNAEKEHLTEILDIFQAFFRDLLLLKNGRPETELVNLDMKETLFRQLPQESTQSLLQKLDALDAGRYYLQRNVNRQLAMEIMLMRMNAA